MKYLINNYFLNDLHTGLNFYKKFNKKQKSRQQELIKNNNVSLIYYYF